MEPEGVVRRTLSWCQLVRTGRAALDCIGAALVVIGCSKGSEVAASDYEVVPSVFQECFRDVGGLQAAMTSRTLLREDAVRARMAGEGFEYQTTLVASGQIEVDRAGLSESEWIGIWGYGIATFEPIALSVEVAIDPFAGMSPNEVEAYMSALLGVRDAEGDETCHVVRRGDRLLVSGQKTGTRTESAELAIDH